MRLPGRVSWRRCGVGLILASLVTVLAFETQSEDEISLVIGEPYEAMRKRSTRLRLTDRELFAPADPSLE